MIFPIFDPDVILEGILFGLFLVVVLSLLLSIVDHGTDVIFKSH